jgi:hypothetical protein
MSTKMLAALVALTSAMPLVAQEPQIITGLKQPESVGIGPGGKVYVSETGEYEKANDGYISILEGGKLRKFATGLDDPHGIKWFKDHLFVSDNMGMVWRIDSQGAVERFVDVTDFPRKITNFNDIEIDPDGNLYISDSGDWEGRGGAIYRVTQDKRITPVITDEDDWRLLSPNGLLMDGPDKLLVVDYTTGNLSRIDLKRRSRWPATCRFRPHDRRWRRWRAASAPRTGWCGMPAAGSSSPTTPDTGCSCWPSRMPSRWRSR